MPRPEGLSPLPLCSRRLQPDQQRTQHGAGHTRGLWAFLPVSSAPFPHWVAAIIWGLVETAPLHSHPSLPPHLAILIDLGNQDPAPDFLLAQELIQEQPRRPMALPSLSQANEKGGKGGWGILGKRVPSSSERVPGNLCPPSWDHVR